MDVKDERQRIICEMRFRHQPGEHSYCSLISISRPDKIYKMGDENCLHDTFFLGSRNQSPPGATFILVTQVVFVRLFGRFVPQNCFCAVEE